jgi:hypothetical protein
LQQGVPNKAKPKAPHQHFSPSKKEVKVPDLFKRVHQLNKPKRALLDPQWFQALFM